MVLSLFDGIGVIWHALEEALGPAGLRGRLLHAWSVELIPKLSEQVESWWRRHANHAHGRFVVEPVGHDVWDLVRNGGSQFAALLRRIPPGSVFLIAGGSPCQQFSPMGRGGGMLGLAGRESYHMYVFPILLWMTQRARPDLLTHVMVENAGAMKELHPPFIRRMLSISAFEWTQRGTGQFAHFKRERAFVSTLPGEGRPRGSPKRTHVWDPGWQRISTEQLPTMMRTRSNEGQPLVFSSYQYAPRWLIYDQRWRGCTPAEAAVRIRTLLPVRLQKAWDIIASQQWSKDRQTEDQDDVARWISEFGPPLGFRPACTRERAKAVGLWQYLSALELTDKEGADALGNAFDKDVVASRIGGALIECLADVVSPRVSEQRRWPHPLDLVRSHRELTNELRRRKFEPEAGPFPHDLLEAPWWRGSDGSALDWLPPGGAAFARDPRPRALDLHLARFPTGTSQPAPSPALPPPAPMPLAGGGGDPLTPLVEQEAVALQLPTGLGLRAGSAGALPILFPEDPQAQQCCAADALLQVLAGQPPGRLWRVAAIRARDLTEHARTVLGLPPGSPLHTGDVWAVLQAALARPNERGPLLVELALNERGERIVAHVHSALYGWDGRLVAVLQTGCGTVEDHLVPLGFTSAAGSCSAVVQAAGPVRHLNVSAFPEAVLLVDAVHFTLIGWRTGERPAGGEALLTAALAANRIPALHADARWPEWEQLCPAWLLNSVEALSAALSPDATPSATTFALIYVGDAETHQTGLFTQQAPALGFAAPGVRLTCRALPEGPIDFAAFVAPGSVAWARVRPDVGDAQLQQFLSAARGGRPPR